jgi:thioredoxin 1
MAVYLRASDYPSLLKEPGVKVLKFTATWCGPCKVVAPKFEQLAKDHNVMCLNVDIDEEADLAKHYNIASVPTFVILKNDKLAHRMTGTDMKKLEQMVIASN